MQLLFVAIGILCLFGGVGGTLRFGLGSLTIGGTLGGVLIVLGVML
jgi:hypothetical protein